MNYSKRFYLFVLMLFIAQWLILGLSETSVVAQQRTEPLIIDHRCTDLSQISDQSIDSVQAYIRLHYAHTSHGEQLTVGLQRLEDQNSKYSVAIESSSLPDEAGAFCIFDGQETETYITPDLYWDSPEGFQLTQNVLNHNPTINVSMWAWCTQQDENSSDDTQRYLDAMAALEETNPGVIFVYLTGNAQSASSNRYARNNQIRDYCIANNKVLFDFADLDCWYNDERHMEGGIPTEHPHYHGDVAGHTTYGSCENKGRAVWWMMARLVRWTASQPTFRYSVSPTNLSFALVYINSLEVKTITITNTGTEAVTIDSLVSNSSVFSLALVLKKASISTIPGFTLGVGESRDVQVTFTPPAAQMYTGILTIYSAQAGNKTVSMSGQGRDISPDTQLIQPGDLEYIGAFRLPDESPEEQSWPWGGSGMTYYPDGDPDGPADGYPGSIFGIGHAWNMYVSEINIPVPVISPTKDVNELNTALTLQGFYDIRAGLFSEILTEMLCAGIEYLPKQGSQTTDKLHVAWGQHDQYGQILSHTWCELDLSNPQTAGPWYFGNYSSASINDYIFEIPKPWADAYTPGQYLASGRFREGGLSGRGPALFSYGPWNDGNPPAQNSILSSITQLLLYDNYDIWDNPDTLINYRPDDEWSGGAWLEAGSASAVIFVGTKGFGSGYESNSFRGQIIFYDPADLADVAQGIIEPGKPQPYATLDIDQYLFNANPTERYHLGAAAFDRTRRLLYVFEPRGDGDKPLVHVWRVDHPNEVKEAKTKATATVFVLSQNYPNPFNPETTIEYYLPRPTMVNLSIYNATGKKVVALVNEWQDTGQHSVDWDVSSSNKSSGVYFYKIIAGEYTEIKKCLVLK